MPCDLAVSIAKAAVADAYRQGLLQTEEGRAAVEGAIEAYLVARDNEWTPQFHQLTSSQHQWGIVARFTYQGVTYTIDRSGVRAEVNRLVRRAADALATELAELLEKCADALFAQQVQRTLAGMSLSGAVDAETFTVEEQGQRQTARIYTVTV